jgi:hypothetical protein
MLPEFPKCWAVHQDVHYCLSRSTLALILSSEPVDLRVRGQLRVTCSMLCKKICSISGQRHRPRVALVLRVAIGLGDDPQFRGSIQASILTNSVRALANRDYLGDWFARTTHVRHSPLACIVPKALPGKAPGTLPVLRAQ